MNDHDPTRVDLTLRLLEIECFCFSVVIGAPGGILLKNVSGLAAAPAHAVAFFLGMIAMFPALASISRRRGAALTFMKFAAGSLGGAVLLMWLRGLSG
jgi:hypothetical protein